LIDLGFGLAGEGGRFGQQIIHGAQGPLLFGTGIGYTFRISDSLAFLVDLDAIAGIAVVDKLGTAIHLHTSVSADMCIGLAVGF